MRYLIVIAILFSQQSFGQQTSIRDYKLPDDYITVRTQLIDIYKSDQTLSQRQLDMYNLLKSFIKAYPLSPNTLTLLASASNLTVIQYDSLYNFLDTTLRENKLLWVNVDITKTQIDAAETGKIFPTITLTDTLNKSINTNSFNGKILFLDLWSSWCVSCREQFPDLKKIYKNYKSTEFEILGVSMDSNKNAWISALKKDKLPWPQYCELVDFHENSLVKKFYITGIPANFLIDKNGILIGQDLSPEELKALLSRL
jgi:thiol-disulfide isomerase/thioredoxin